MSRFLISGLVNVETTARVRGFPISYYPIDYPFFGIQTQVSGVGWNLAAALTTLENQVDLLSMTGKDFQGAYIADTLAKREISTAGLLPLLRQTPSSVVLYDDTGRRQVYCDLKDIQETAYPVPADALEAVDVVVACNINFSRPLLAMAKAAGKTIATDVHVLSDPSDAYNREFLQYADIVFLSDEGIGEDYRELLSALWQAYRPAVLVLGRGSKGAVLCYEGQLYCLPAVQVGTVQNTVGAGDALFAAFLHGYAQGKHPLDALVEAEIFASRKICANGGARGFPAAGEWKALCCQFAPEIYHNMTKFPLERK